MITPQQQLDRFMSMFTTSSEGLWIMDESGNNSFYNSNFYNQFDLPQNPRVDDWIALVHPDDRGIFSEQVKEHREHNHHGEPVRSEFRVLKKDGSYCWIESFGVMNRDTENYMVGNHKDITLEKSMLSKMHNLAFFDQVTGLPNGEKFRLDFTSIDDSATHTLVFIHAESIKSYFNLYGSSFTNRIVKYIVSCFSVFKKYNAQCYCTALDVFLIYIPNFVTEKQLEQMFKAFMQLCLDANQYEPQLSGMIHVALGAIQYTKENDFTAEEVIQWTSKTCEYAMHHSPKKWAICNNKLKTSIERFFYIESQIQQAIENDEISIHLQPIFDVKTKSLSTFEALARWEESDIGPIFPDEFIPTAERKGLISALGESVFRQACNFICEYNDKWHSQIRININVSVLQLYNSQFPNKVIRLVEKLNIDPSWIVLELTESVMLDSKHYAIKQLQKLKDYGFKLSMDDFGTGYTSIMGFFQLPFKQIKIDRELVEEAKQTKEALSYMEFITLLCSDNKIEVTAEGIEDKATLDLLSTIGVTYLQGYLLSKPLKVPGALEFHHWPIK